MPKFKVGDKVRVVVSERLQVRYKSNDQLKGHAGVVLSPDTPRGVVVRLDRHDSDLYYHDCMKVSDKNDSRWFDEDQLELITPKVKLKVGKIYKRKVGDWYSNYFYVCKYVGTSNAIFDAIYKDSREIETEVAIIYADELLEEVPPPPKTGKIWIVIKEDRFGKIIQSSHLTKERALYHTQKDELLAIKEVDWTEGEGVEEIKENE